MNRKTLVEKFCEALNKADLKPFEETVYAEMVFIDKVEDAEIEVLTRELERLS